jgi:hypothetical protein
MSKLHHELAAHLAQHYPKLLVYAIPTGFNIAKSRNGLCGLYIFLNQPERKEWSTLHSNGYKWGVVKSVEELDVLVKGYLG